MKSFAEQFSWPWSSTKRRRSGGTYSAPRESDEHEEDSDDGRAGASTCGSFKHWIANTTPRQRLIAGMAATAAVVLTVVLAAVFGSGQAAGSRPVGVAHSGGGSSSGGGGGGGGGGNAGGSNGGGGGTVSRTRAFLQEQLPLRVVLTTPVEIVKGEPGASVQLQGWQAITVVFSRPVIALGSDFPGGSAAELVPFTLSCPMPGRFRWVTTTIARFDPEVQWPSDLSCTFKWNSALITYDGAPLQLDGVPASRPLSSTPLSMYLSRVTSHVAANLTGDRWDASVGTPADLLPEVPPDGRIQLYFSSPVSLKRLRGALKLLEGSGGFRSADDHGVDVLGECTEPAWGWEPFSAGSAGGTTPGPTSPDDANVTCVEVAPRAALKPNTRYSLVLPQGSRYHALSGPLGAEQQAQLGGLRPFRLGFNEWQRQGREGGLDYRRLDAWLVHGLSPDTTPEQLATNIVFCEVDPKGSPQCIKQPDGSTSLPFTAALQGPGVIRLSVPGLQEGRKYRVRVQANASSKDGYGQGLQASTTEFFMRLIKQDMVPPSTPNVLSVLEAGADTLNHWPYIVHSPVGSLGYGTASAWTLDTNAPEDVGLLVELSATGSHTTDLTKRLGAPAAQVKVPEDVYYGRGAPGWSELRQVLPKLTPENGGRTVVVLQICCSPATSDGKVQLLLKTSLSLNVISGGGGGATAWVLDSGVGGGPVMGAEVSVYGVRQQYYMGSMGSGSSSGPKTNRTLLASCTTGPDGVCSVAFSEQDTQASWPLVAFARSPDGQVALLPSAGWLQQPSTPAAQATLVLDRKAVVEGDSLKVTGFAQAVLPDLTLGLLPAGTRAVLEVSPPWEQAGGGGPEAVAAASGFGGGRGSMAAMPGVAMGAATASSFGWVGPAGGGPGSGPKSSPPPRTFAEVDGTSGTLHAEFAVPRSVRLQPYTLMLKIDPAKLANTGSQIVTAADSGTTRTAGGRMARRMAMGAAGAGGSVAVTTCSGTSNGGAASSGVAHAAAANADADEYIITPDNEVHMASMTDGGVVSTAAAVAAGAATVGASEGYPGDGSGTSSSSADIASFEAAAEDVETSSSNDGAGAGEDGQAAHRRRDLHSAAAAAVMWAAAVQGVAPGDPSVVVSSLDPIDPIEPVPILYDSGAMTHGSARARTLADEDPYAAWPVVATVSFTVADPRPPTVELKLTLPPWAPNGSVVPVSVLAVSYIGASVAGANVTLTWSTPLASGVLPLTTDAGGAANGTIDLAALPEANRTAEYDTLSVTAEWIGPTRERIVETAEVTLAHAPYRLELTRSLDTPLPGVAFTVDAALTPNSPTGTPLEGTDVTVTLSPSTSEAATCASVAVGAAVATCTAVSGAGYSSTCQLALPCVGQFELRGCANVPLGDGSGAARQVCSSATVGRNAMEWGLAPWNDHPEPTIKADRPSHSQGDTVTVSLTNPWPGARLLLVWGNQLATRSKVVDKLPSGPLVSASFGPLGPECRGGCSLAAVLDVPRLRLQDFLPARDPGVPVSKLFDPVAPHTHTMTLALTVRQDNHLEVAVQVAGGEGGALATVRDADGKEVPAVQPGQQAQVTVSVKVPASSAAGGEGTASASTPSPGTEVTLYAVDKAFLDLLPYGLPAVQEAMVLQLASDIQLYGMAAYRIAPEAVRAVYDTMLRRLTQLDPWLPVDTTVQPYGGYWRGGSTAAAVDLNDTVLLEQYATAITPLPYGPPPPGSSGRYAQGGAMAMESAAADMMLAGGLPAPMATAVAARDVSASAFAAGGGAGASNAAAATKTASSDGGSGAPAAPRSAGDFVVTPLFAVAHTDANGAATFNFTGPQKLGAFVLRAFAASGSSAKYGSSESRIVVRRQLSLVPSVPRFVRVNDTFEAGVIVTVPTPPATVTITASLLAPNGSAAAPLKAPGHLTKTLSFTVQGGLQQEARVRFAAVAVGTAGVLFTAEATEGEGASATTVSDSLQLEIPVHGQQGSVVVATTFALTASPSQGSGAVEWTEGTELPQAVPGSGGLTLTAGVGYLPSILSTYDTLLQEEEDRVYPQAQPAVLWATAAAVLSYYGKQINGSQVSETKAALADLTGPLTDPTFGLLWTPPTRWSGWWPDRADVPLNTWAVVLAAAHAPAYEGALSLLTAELAASWSSLAASSLPSWRSAAARQLVADAVRSRAEGYPYDDWTTISWVRLALGADWDPRTAGAGEQVAADLSLEHQLQAFSNQAKKVQVSLQARLVLSLALLAQGPSNASPQTVFSTVDLVTGRLRVQGRTAYVAEGEGGRSAAGLEDQALALLLLLRSGATHQLLPKLAAHVANPTTSTGGGPWPLFVMCPSYRGQGLAVLALSEYDRSRGSAQPNLDLSARANGMVVLQAAFHASANSSSCPAIATSTTPWERLPPPASGSTGALSFQATGSGEATVSASLLFVPSVLPAFPAYRGLYVEATLQLVDPRSGGPTGRRVAAVPLASLVALTVQLTSPDDLGAVTLEVMMPGGLEPIDPNLASGQSLGTSCGAAAVGPAGLWRSWYSWWWWPVCPAQETRASVVTFSYLHLSAGTTSVTVYAVAASAGRFVLPPVRAFANDQPELMGMTAAGTFTVCADCTAPTYGEVPPPPKPCPKDCSGNGVCDLSTGTCVCSDGFTGADCGALVPA